ncbi:hypothetical protein HK102_001284 [Quaeritorhiza haematococci]|nr:hypothetical protein HK102_001284 [Quaeritorhiza haematococci]
MSMSKLGAPVLTAAGTRANSSHEIFPLRFRDHHTVCRQRFGRADARWMVVLFLACSNRSLGTTTSSHAVAFPAAGLKYGAPIRSPPFKLGRSGLEWTQTVRGAASKAQHTTSTNSHTPTNSASSSLDVAIDELLHLQHQKTGSKDHAAWSPKQVDSYLTLLLRILETCSKHGDLETGVVVHGKMREILLPLFGSAVGGSTVRPTSVRERKLRGAWVWLLRAAARAHMLQRGNRDLLAETLEDPDHGGWRELVDLIAQWEEDLTSYDVGGAQSKATIDRLTAMMLAEALLEYRNRDAARAALHLLKVAGLRVQDAAFLASSGNLDQVTDDVSLEDKFQLVDGTNDLLMGLVIRAMGLLGRTEDVTQLLTRYMPHFKNVVDVLAGREKVARVHLRTQREFVLIGEAIIALGHCKRKGERNPHHRLIGALYKKMIKSMRYILQDANRSLLQSVANIHAETKDLLAGPEDVFGCTASDVDVLHHAVSSVMDSLVEQSAHTQMAVILASERRRLTKSVLTLLGKHYDLRSSCEQRRRQTLSRTEVDDLTLKLNDVLDVVDLGVLRVVCGYMDETLPRVLTGQDRVHEQRKECERTWTLVVDEIQERYRAQQYVKKKNRTDEFILPGTYPEMILRLRVHAMIDNPQRYSMESTEDLFEEWRMQGYVSTLEAYHILMRGWGLVSKIPKISVIGEDSEQKQPQLQALTSTELDEALSLSNEVPLSSSLPAADVPTHQNLTRIFQLMLRSGHQPTAETFVTLFESLTPPKVHYPGKHVMQIIYRFENTMISDKSYALRHTPRTLTALIRCLIMNNDLEGAMRRYSDAPLGGVERTIHMYAALVQACSKTKEGSMLVLKDVRYSLKREFPHVSEWTSDLWVGLMYCCWTLRDATAAWEVYEEFRGSMGTGNQAVGLGLGTQALPMYGIMLRLFYEIYGDSLAHLGDQVLADMRASGLGMTLACYKPVLRYYARLVTGPASSKDVNESARDSEVAAVSTSAESRVSLEDFEKLFDQVTKAEKLITDGELWDTYILACVGAGEWKKALEIAQDLYGGQIMDYVRKKPVKPLPVRESLGLKRLHEGLKGKAEETENRQDIEQELAWIESIM